MLVIERGVVEAGACDAGPDDAPTRCCTVVAQNASGAMTWVQVLAGSVNMMYPYAGDPVETLRVCSVRSPQGLEVIEWEPTSFATFEVPASSARELAFFVHQLFTMVLGCDEAGYEPTTMVETLDP
jgi:hypothetical protein